MAIREHLAILKQGVEVWNQWRSEHMDTQPDLRGSIFIYSQLRGVDLSDADLRGANFSRANLVSADLRQVDLRNANFKEANLNSVNLGWANLGNIILSDAHLNRADLTYAQLQNANLTRAKLDTACLRGADLSGASLNCAYLSGADLSDADLSGADLSDADLTGADLSRSALSHTTFNRVKVWSTTFGNVDLSAVNGLENVKHEGPSTIGIDTIYRSKGNIPEAFLQGAGVDDMFISNIRSLINKPIEYYSCFISYASKDEAFAKQLYIDLQNNNVRCWFAPEHLKWGERIHTGIDEAIHLHDKLLLILSKHSVASGWVEHEVKTALVKERKKKCTVLFPIRLDKAVLDSPLAWATAIRHEHNIGDFSSWKNHNDYQKAFDRLLRDLKAEPSHRL